MHMFLMPRWEICSVLGGNCSKDAHLLAAKTVLALATQFQDHKHVVRSKPEIRYDSMRCVWHAVNIEQ
jgi:hypothetical protein